MEMPEGAWLLLLVLVLLVNRSQKTQHALPFLKVFVILFIFSPSASAAVAASFVDSATALYLSAAVLVGEIVCNHENLISAQIC